MVIIPEEPIGIFVLEKIPVERRSSVGPHERLELLLGENELAMIVGPLTLRSRDVNSASASDVLIATSIVFVCFVNVRLLLLIAHLRPMTGDCAENLALLGLARHAGTHFVEPEMDRE